MQIDIVPFEPAHLDTVRDFSELTWERPTDPAFFRWRYLDCPSQPIAYLGMRGDECVAMLGFFRKQWRYRDETRWSWEIHDWFASPKARGGGFGVRVIHKLMDTGRCIHVVGGTADTRDRIPKLGWKEAGPVTTFVLPLSGQQTADKIAGRVKAPRPLLRVGSELATRLWFQPRAGRIRRGWEVLPVAFPGEEILGLYRQVAGYGSVSLPDPEMLRWMIGGHPSMGQFVSLYFLDEGALRGWGLGVVRPGADGLQARILELFAKDADVKLYRWMVMEVVRRLAAFGPIRIGADSSCAILGQAYRRCRFLKVDELPMYVWPGVADGPPAPRPILVGGLFNDVPLLPYPPAWPPPAWRA